MDNTTMAFWLAGAVTLLLVVVVWLLVIDNVRLRRSNEFMTDFISSVILAPPPDREAGRPVIKL